MSTTGDEGPSVQPLPVEVASPLIARLIDEVGVRAGPLFVGLDGRSGAGKSTVAAVVADRVVDRVGVTVTVIEGDQFYAGGSAASWDRQTPAEKAARVIDWRRQRFVLRQLREHGEARWRPFDWDAKDWDADHVPLSSSAVQSVTGRVVLLEGAYSCRPELHDLLDLRVLVEVPRAVRRRQLLRREGEDHRSDWERRWSAAEEHYFGTVMPARSFDLVIGST